MAYSFIGGLKYLFNIRKQNIEDEYIWIEAGIGRDISIRRNFFNGNVIYVQIGLSGKHT